MDTVNTDQVVHHQLSQSAIQLGSRLSADVISINSPMQFSLDDAVRDEVEALRENHNGGPQPERLAVVLQTPGGFIETVERIVSVMRRHYEAVDFIIPNYAYSAGTVLALSGDEIYMNYYSVLGPIDPQFETAGGEQVPGMGYIAKYNELIAKINSVPDEELHKVRAELSFLVQKFEPAKLFHIEQAIDHSKDLIRDWLPRYKFRRWTVTEGSKTAVTQKYRRDRANQIANALSDAERWHSHGRGISMRELGDDEIGLKVIDFGKDADLNADIRHYYGLFTDYQQKLGMSSAIHTKHRLRRVP